MKYIESPEVLTYSRTEVSLFLGGGITSCPNWQQEMVGLLKDTNLTLLNPRREDFPIGDPNAAYEQIKWEFANLINADAILFWFPCETLCPIVLYELGTWTPRRSKPLCIGVHPKYARKQDVEIQTELVLPNQVITYSLEDLAKQVINWRPIP